MSEKSNSLSQQNSFPSVDKSLAMLEMAKEIMYPPTQTLAKGPSQFVEGVSPVFVKSGAGGHIFDIDGNEFIDLNMGIGPVSLGYAYEAVDEAIKEQLKDGISFSLVHYLEYEVAELIKSIIPNAEVVRFSKTGADVCSAAVRIARAYTKRSKILCCGYHGWHDWYISTTSMKSGIPKSHFNEVQLVEYNNIEAIKSLLDKDTAAVILEPVLFDPPSQKYLQELLDICNKNGTLLIFDEMWTGFRLSLGGAQSFFNVTPHLALYSKACANGMPLSILTGKAKIMKVLEDEVFFYTTFGGETLSLAAAKATITTMQKEPVIETIWNLGTHLLESTSKIIEDLNLCDFFEVKGYPCRSLLNIKSQASEDLGIDPLIIKSFLQQVFIRNGILWSGFHNLCYSHTKSDIDNVISCYQDALKTFKNIMNNPDAIKDSIMGKPIQPVFRKTKY